MMETAGKGLVNVAAALGLAGGGSELFDLLAGAGLDCNEIARVAMILACAALVVRVDVGRGAMTLRARWAARKERKP